MPPDEKVLLGYFTELLPQCKSSKTSHKEGKGEIRVTPVKGKEIICFFIIDNDDARQALKINRSAPTEEKRIICDCLIFFGRTDIASNIYEETFCLVELKGSDLKHAMQQILNTHKHLWKLLEDSPCKHQLQVIRKKAYIYKHGNTPKETKDKKLVALRKELDSTFEGNFAHRRESDIGPFLRK